MEKTAGETQLSCLHTNIDRFLCKFEEFKSRAAEYAIGLFGVVEPWLMEDI